MHNKLLHAAKVNPRLKHMNKHLRNFLSALLPRRSHQQFKHLQLSAEPLEGEGVKHSHFKAHRPRKVTPLKIKW